MDAFYVSVERRENPSLIGQRVIVGADPKGGKGRGVVMACSYEAREIGIRSGMPIGMAWRKAPQAVFLRPNYDLYGDVSESVINVLRSFADVLEHVSIDEAFLDVSAKVKDFGEAEAYARRVKLAVREREGLACTIGVAPNKSVAKIASDLAKPDGVKVVRPEEVTAFLDPLPVTRISGVGAKTAEVLERVGVRTIGELARFKGAELKKILGKNAVWLWGIARGLEQLPVEERPDPKSISVERTFASHVMDEEVLAEVCHDLIAEFADKAHRVRLVGVRVTHLVRPKTRQPKLSSFE